MIVQPPGGSTGAPAKKAPAHAPAARPAPAATHAAASHAAAAHAAPPPHPMGPAPGKLAALSHLEGGGTASPHAVSNIVSNVHSQTPHGGSAGAHPAASGKKKDEGGPTPQAGAAAARDITDMGTAVGKGVSAASAAHSGFLEHVQRVQGGASVQPLPHELIPGYKPPTDTRLPAAQVGSKPPSLHGTPEAQVKPEVAGKILGPLGVAGGAYGAYSGIQDIRKGHLATGIGGTTSGVANTASGGLATASAFTRNAALAERLGGASGVGAGVGAVADGGVDMYQGVRSHNTGQVAQGGAKALGGGLMIAGGATLDPAMTAAGAAVYGGALLWQHRAGVEHALSSAGHALSSLFHSDGSRVPVLYHRPGMTYGVESRL